MRIAITSDHAAIEPKSEFVEWLIEAGHEVADLELGHYGSLRRCHIKQLD